LNKQKDSIQKAQDITAISTALSEAKSAFSVIQQAKTDADNAAAEAARKPNEPTAKNAPDHSSLTGLNEDPDPKSIAEYIENNLMKAIIVQYDNFFRRRMDPTFSATSGMAGEPGLFARLYNQYLDRREKDNQMTFRAAQELSEAMHANGLIPREVLAVTKVDKTIFVFVTLFIRLFALYLAEYMIEKGVVARMVTALSSFIGIYLGLFIVFVLIVNFDTYRLRIIFNYVNFHAHRGLVFAHILFLILFSILFFMIIKTINFPVQGLEITAISEEEKVELMYRLEILTMIIWMFLMIMVILM
jgi:hypothetical protein